MKTAVFTGGGTGGHIFPGLAAAEQLKKIDTTIRIVWIGSSRGVDRSIVESSAIADEFIGIPSGKLRRYFSLQNFADIFKILTGFVLSFFILLKFKPQIVFSKGGFVSVPPCYAAALLKIPVFTHECDYSPGLATRLNSRTAAGIFLSFEATQSFFSADKQSLLTVTGNPVRQMFYDASAERGRAFLGIARQNAFDAEQAVDGASDDARPSLILLVLGGSLGAKQINQLVQENIDKLTEKFFVVHQTGKGAPGCFLTDDYLNDRYKRYEFIRSEIADVIASADIVISRAGSNFLWECAVNAKPLILIPLEGSGTRGDQVENALFFEKNNAAAVLRGGDVCAEHLMRVLDKMQSSAVRTEYAQAVKKLIPVKNPAFTIASILAEKIGVNVC